MSRALNRTERLRKIEQLYLYGAFTDEEMAERVGVDSRTTIYKDRQLLMTEGIPFEEVERGRWRIDRKKYLSNLRVNVHQAAQLYLMARRLARQTRRPNPHVVSVLKSLALILHQPLMDRLHQSADFIPQATDESEKTAVLEKLVACWVEQRKVRFRYQGLHARQPTVHLVSPYLLEPSLLGEAIYLVGYSETMNKIVPFKIDRIEKAADTSQPIIPPESFDETEFIRSVWSIWGSEGEPVTVKLRFRGETAVRRVQETVWHPNQAEPELLPNGDLIWTAQVAEWREMLPWVRSWGADCEVLEPPELKGVVVRHVREMMKQYGLQVKDEPAADPSVSSKIKKSTADPKETDYTVDNDGPTPAEDVSPELMELFDEFMNAGDEDEQ